MHVTIIQQKLEHRNGIVYITLMLERFNLENKC